MEDCKLTKVTIGHVRSRVGLFFSVNCFFQSAHVNECWGFIINIMWYELIAQAESYLIPPRLFKFAHCFSRQIGLIKTLNGAETMGIYKSFSWSAWGLSLLGICFFPKQCSTVKFQLRCCEAVRKRRWNLANACTYNRLCVDSSVYSAWVNTDSDPVENEEGLIIKIRPDNSFEITVVQRS